LSKENGYLEGGEENHSRNEELAKTAYKSKKRVITQEIIENRMETWTGDHHPCKDEVCYDADKNYCSQRCKAKELWCKQQGYCLTGIKFNTDEF